MISYRYWITYGEKNNVDKATYNPLFMCGGYFKNDDDDNCEEKTKEKKLFDNTRNVLGNGWIKLYDTAINASEYFRSIYGNSWQITARRWHSF